MKKLGVLFLGLIVIVAGFTSCKKIIDKIFNGVDVKAPEVRIDIPAIPFVVPGEVPVTSTTSFNLDSVIKANTAGVFGASDVKSVKLKQVQIDLPAGDALNNLSNFQSVRVELSSDKNTTPIEIVNFTFDDTYAVSKTLAVTNNVDLLPYLTGSQLSYTMYGRVRKPTTKPLTFVTQVTLRVD